MIDLDLRSQTHSHLLPQLFQLGGDSLEMLLVALALDVIVVVVLPAELASNHGADAPLVLVRASTGKARCCLGYVVCIDSKSESAHGPTPRMIVPRIW